MNSKNRFITVGLALTYSLLLPNTSFSEVIITKPSGLYISGKYKPSISIFSDFSVKEVNVTTKGLIALKKEARSIDIPNTSPHNTEGLGKPDNFNIPYTAEFQDNFASFSGAIGYSFFKGLRIEIEASYEEFDVKNPGYYIVNDAFRYFALARKVEGKTTTQPKGPEPLGRNKQPDNNTTKVFHTVMRNDGLAISSNMINVCYDFLLDQLPVLPYICGGIGVDAIEFFDALHIKLASQIKLGITYLLSSNINLFVDVYYHRVIGSNKFKNLKVHHVAELYDAPKVTSAVATLNVGYLGGEIGVRFIF